MKIPDTPDLLWQRLQLRNRVADWRGRSAEWLFLAMVSALALVLTLAAADPHWERLVGAVAPWNSARTAVAAGLGLMALLLLQLRREVRARLAQQRSDWLAALPIDPARRLDYAVLVAQLRLAAKSVLGILLIAWTSSRIGSTPSPVLIAAAAALIGSVLLGRLAAPAAGAQSDRVQRGAPAVVSRIPADAAGLALLGLALEPTVTRLPRSSWALALGFLLIPAGGSLWALLGVVIGFTALGMSTDLVAHWRSRFLADQAWLAAVPLRPQSLLMAYVRPLSARSLLLALGMAAALHALGAPPAFVGAAAVLVSLLITHAVLTGYATRRRPRLYSLWLAAHGAALFGCIQVLPPLLPLLWLALLVWLWRRGHH